MLDHDVAFDGVAAQAELVRRGEVSARELVQLAVGRIERLDPELNAFGAVLAERALADADHVDERRARGDRAPLLGVPVAVKDEIDIAGEVTSRGTGAITVRATADAEVVRRLRDAGAIVVGKTTIPELGLWPFTESVAWGVTRNPWDVERTPGGSSGGSAAAVAAGLVPAAIGVDGAGSIRIPAACCGVFGLKPQSGRVPRAPHDVDGNHWICFGPLTRSGARQRDRARRHPGTRGHAGRSGRVPGRAQHGFLRYSGKRIGTSKTLRIRDDRRHDLKVSLSRKVRRDLRAAMRRADTRSLNVTAVLRVRTADGGSTIRREVRLKR